MRLIYSAYRFSVTCTGAKMMMMMFWVQTKTTAMKTCDVVFKIVDAFNHKKQISDR